MDEYRLAVMALSGVPGMGPLSLKRYMDWAGSDLLGALNRQDQPDWLRSSTKSALLKWRDYVGGSDIEVKLGQMDIRYVIKEDAAFPRRLRELRDCPFGLYCKCRNSVDLSNAVAIVGTRYPSSYGRKVAREIAAGLSSKGYVTISGLAEGIDGEVHRASLECGGQTAAFIGSGHCRLYPRSHTQLMEEITSSAGVWSEFPLYRRADRQSFPQRNRLVSGASMAVIVIESGLKGGSMITARMAGEQGRTLLAIPGRIDSGASAGSHQLIRDGAILVTSVDEVLDELPHVGELPLGEIDSTPYQAEKQNGRLQELGQQSIEVYHLITEMGDSLFPDQIAMKVGADMQTINTTLMRLEISGFLVRRYDGSFEVS